MNNSQLILGVLGTLTKEIEHNFMNKLLKKKKKKMEGGTPNQQTKKADWKEMHQNACSVSSER